MQNEIFQFQLTKLFRVRDTSCPKEKYVQEENIVTDKQSGKNLERSGYLDIYFWRIMIIALISK